MARVNMARSRKNRSNNGMFTRIVYSPVHHGLFAAKNVVNAGLDTVGKVVDAGVVGVDTAGKAVTTHANALVSNVFSGVAGLGGKARKTRGGKRRVAKRSAKRTMKRSGKRTAKRRAH